MKLTSISLEHIFKIFSYGTQSYTILADITYRFEHNVYYTITGSSGSGKSTLLHIIGSLDTPTTGHISYDYQSPDLHTTQIGFVLQAPYLIPELSVIENVMTKPLIAGIPYDSAYQTAAQLLAWVGMDQYAHHQPLSLSGGQQQRISFARALGNQPAFLLADEPTGNLDAHTTKCIAQLLVACQQEWQMGIIVVSHDPLMINAADTHLQLNTGTLTHIR